MAGKIRRKVLTVILSTALGATLLTSITWIDSIFAFRNTVSRMSERFWETAVGNTQNALAEQAKNHLLALAQAKAMFADEQLRTMKIQTETVTESLLLEQFDDILEAPPIGKTGFTFLLNEKGQVLLSPDHLSVAVDSAGNALWEDYLHSADPAAQELARRMTAGERFVTDSAVLNGKAVYIAGYPLSEINWSIGVAVPVEDVIAPVEDMRRNIDALIDTNMAELNRNIVKLLLFIGADIISIVIVTIVISKKVSDRLTAPIIALSNGAVTIDGGTVNHRFTVKTGDELEVLSDTFNRMIENITAISGEQKRIETELRIATKIQASMLPSVFPPFPERREVDIYAEMHAAKEVGGDFYDFFFITDNHLAVVIADVSGKGVPAALFMVIAKTLIKEHTIMGKSLDTVFYTVNNHLCENNNEGMFVTAFMGILEITTGTFRYVNAGHNPPLIRRNRVFTWLNTKPGLVLAAMEHIWFQVMETVLAKGDMLFLYTDGVTEAVNQTGELFSCARLLETMNRHTAPINDYIGRMLQAIREFENGTEQTDDMTMLILERKEE